MIFGGVIARRAAVPRDRGPVRLDPASPDVAGPRAGGGLDEPRPRSCQPPRAASASTLTPPKRPRRVARYLTRARHVIRGTFRRPARPRRCHTKGGRPMRLFRMLALGASMLVLFGACSTGGGGSKPTVKIGSDGFDEARVVAEVYAQVLEADGYTVDRAGIGARGPEGDSGRAGERPDRHEAGVHRQRPRLLRRDLDQRPGQERDRPAGEAERRRAAGSRSSATRRARTRTPWS